MMEFRRHKEMGKNIGEFISFMKQEFGERFQLFEYDDIVQVWCRPREQHPIGKPFTFLYIQLSIVL
ncbi:hypothetical protein [Priestia abyssalis]|uniref:hypothetical protein n=1 Tax=Priestia abyssalis TaxID=1221450 RepID=UPI001117972E|nr:hypothetical protein [Priestia abyssalis]